MREVAVEELFAGPFTTVLEPGELIEEVVVPASRPHEGSAYVAIENRASGYPLAGAGTRVVVREGRIVECAVALTGVGAMPRRAREIEEALLAAAEIPVVEAESRYREQLVRVVVQRAFARARERAAS
jgi:CO/xanthine dehydrogenase FAD-binding subunit